MFLINWYLAEQVLCYSIYLLLKEKLRRFCIYRNTILQIDFAVVVFYDFSYILTKISRGMHLDLK